MLQDNKELFDIAADRAYNLIGKEENKVTSLVHLLCIHIKSFAHSLSMSERPQVERKHLDLFKTFTHKLQDKEKREEAGYDSSPKDWRDRYEMTFLMRLLLEAKKLCDQAPSGKAVSLLLQAWCDVRKQSKKHTYF